MEQYDAIHRLMTCGDRTECDSVLTQIDRLETNDRRRSARRCTEQLVWDSWTSSVHQVCAAPRCLAIGRSHSRVGVRAVPSCVLRRASPSHHFGFCEAESTRGQKTYGEEGKKDAWASRLGNVAARHRTTQCPRAMRSPLPTPSQPVQRLHNRRSCKP